MNKKLQVFVSSTYTDLIEERQAAVQAILDAGHIPAGMELFKAGKSQMQTIHKWIDESDVYMLILGGRYGSIEEESGLSYTELEYNYALFQGKPVFAIVLKDSFLYEKAASDSKDTIFEKDNTDKYKSFKEFVKNNIVEFATNIDQITSAVHSNLYHIISDPDYSLKGWIQNNNEKNNDYETLLIENDSLKKQIQKLQEQLNINSQFGRYSFNELVDILSEKELTFPPNFFTNNDMTINLTALKIFIAYYNDFCTGIPNTNLRENENQYLLYRICPFFLSFNLLKKISFDQNPIYEISQSGITLYAELEINGYVEHDY